uniref:Uncharacterized protein n=1 Tax=Arion vulgaris TaxID=1028688 RepID=A0A0B7B000_9EUPU
MSWIIMRCHLFVHNEGTQAASLSCVQFKIEDLKCIVIFENTWIMFPIGENVFEKVYTAQENGLIGRKIVLNLRVLL